MTPQSDASLRQSLLRYAPALWRWLVPLLAVTLAANALLVLQPVVLGAILASLMGGSGGAAPGPLLDLNSLGGRVTEALRFLDPPTILPVLACLYVFQAAIGSALDYAANVIAVKIRVETTRLIQADLLRHLLELDLRFFHRQKTGALMSRLTQDAAITAQGLGPMVKGLIHHGLQLIAYGLYLVSTSIWLTACVLGVAALHFGVTHLLKRPMRERSRRVLDAQADFSTGLQETLQGIRIAKSFGAEAHERAKLGRALDRTAAINFRHGIVERLETPIRAVLDSAGLVCILLVAAAQLRAGGMTVQGLLLYVYVGKLIIAPANHLATHLLWFHSLLSSWEQLSRLLAERPQVVDGTSSPTRLQRGIEVRDVSFSYGRAPALSGVSLDIRKGQMVAVVGPSGSGKSTLTDLILRLYDPDAGRILLDGVDIATLRQAEYRRLFGVVSQECLLFHDAVRNNIRYGRTELTDEDVEIAARTANAHAFIMRLPDGYDTVVGDRGVRLSGGERQRIAIARAIVHRPQILILDEATSALDTESERQVQEALDRVAQHATVIAIAHRLSTILHASKLIVIDKGRVIDAGTHEELLARCELYRRLYEAQGAGSGTLAAGVPGLA